MHFGRAVVAAPSEAYKQFLFSCRPHYDTTVQYVVDMERFLAEHDGSSCLALRLQQSTGYKHKLLGAACMSLQDLLRDVQPNLTGSQQAPSHAVQVLHSRGSFSAHFRL